MLRFSTILLLLVSTLSGGAQSSGNRAYTDDSVTAFFNRTAGWISSDGGLSVKLHDNRVLWLMGDSYVDQLDTATRTLPCLFNVRNSALVQPYNNWNWHQTTTWVNRKKGIADFLKDPAAGDNFVWPNSGVQVGDTVFVFCMNMKNTKPGEGLGFASGGPPLFAKLVMPGLQVAGYAPLPDFDGITFGLGFDAEEGDGYTYVWGYKPVYIAAAVYVARFPSQQPAGPWGFWDGQGWNRDVHRAKPIGEGASNSVYVAKVRNRYVMVSSAFSLACDMGKDIYTATSDHITGPFTERKTIFTIPDRKQGHIPFFYTTVIHPHYINSRNELLITYAVNGYAPCLPFCKEGRVDPDDYKVRGIRVPLELIWQ